MKKVIALLLAVVFLFTAVGCNQTKQPEETTVPHVHEFTLVKEESKAATCTVAGLEVKVCSCGEKQESVIDPVGSHDMRLVMEGKPSCTDSATTMYKCARCGKIEKTTVDAYGHNYEESSSEPSRVIRCLNEGCTACKFGKSNGTHTEALTFKFTKEDEAAIDAKYNEVKALIEAAAKYDAAQHKYAETGALADAFAAVDKLHTELYDLVMNAISQKQLAEIAYYCDMKNAELEETHKYMMDYQTAVIAKFYTLSRPFYDSCYREFYYYGMSEEEIKAFLFDSDAISNPEYTALKEKNNAIEAEFLALSSAEQKQKLPEMYYEFVQNNNKMAKIMGYENYLEYAYENVYGRSYTYQEAAAFSEYVKTYVSPVFKKVYNDYNTIGHTQADRKEYNEQVENSFFYSVAGNTMVNDYIDLLAFNSNPEKQISFSDEFNKLMSNGNMFRGDYEGAFVTTIASVKLPIAYFGRGYDAPFTIVHEFGHYMNEVYSADVAENSDEFDQSYDLLEMHSQGNELLYLCYLKENAKMGDVAHRMVEAYSLVNMLYAVMAGMTIDSFEQAIYLDTYDGPNADQIMADGTITADEYGLLYSSVCSDYGVRREVGNYWEYGMTITSPCYYISYSVSAISVLQLYEMANTDGFDAAKDAYLKLFTYVDEDPGMSMDEVLAYAGMLSYNNEQLYINLNKYFIKE